MLKISYHDRHLEFYFIKDGQVHSGQGLAELLRFLEIYGAIIKKALVYGESPSFTFKRQVYLFLNLIRYLSGCKIIINDRDTNPKRPLVPTYNAKYLL